MIINRINIGVYPEQYQIAGEDIIIDKSPTLNCQTYCIGGIDYFIWKDDVMEYFKNIQRRIQKNQMLVDISDKWLPKLEKLFPPEEFLIKTSYRNSTGSPMTMCLIKTKTIQ